MEKNLQRIFRTRMKLKNNLFHIIETLPDSAGYKLKLDPECFIYKAHFPEKPITPGVCIIGIATEMLEELLGHHLDLKMVKNAKFLSVINPKESPEVYCKFKKITETEEGEIKSNIEITGDDIIYSKLSLIHS